MFKRVSGTKDILPDQVILWQYIENSSRKLFSTYNYQEIRPPIIEEAALFNRSLGEATEIVQKQMFVIKRENDLYALRPEGTASIVRAYLENNLDKTPGFVKLYYIGPMFRAERPQKGRLRQFHHIGVEAIGAYGPDIDIEVIELADSLLKNYGIGGYDLCLNSLGCAEDKKELNKFLKDSLKDKISDLCNDCQLRYERNILRILDCKNVACQAAIKDLKISDSHLCTDCKSHFALVKGGLEKLKIAYQVMPSLVRGLDYYSRTVFEFKHAGLGPQQDALGAGGRYDGLVKELGGNDTGAIGFAFGFERLLLALETQNGQKASLSKQTLVYVIPLGEAAAKQCLIIVSDLRKDKCLSDAFVSIDTSANYGLTSLKSAMRKANDLGARFVLILGEDELKDGSIMLKDMGDGSQKKVKIGELVELLKV
jgi:histidyl-tRNA synthetase